MPLEKYRAKRDFHATPEPSGDGARPKSGRLPLVFVVQKHQASRLHYDFRLEMEGVLKSWAVPKGPSLNPADKRLAMQVEDHPFDYRTFEGTIPEGNYGAGAVMVWDEGSYHAVETDDPTESERTLLEGLAKGSLHFILEGQKLKGEYSLVKIKGQEENSWLLIKKADRFASRDDVRGRDRSVQTGRTLEEIAAGAGAGDPRQIAPPDVRDLGKKGAMPHDVVPMLASLTDEPFNRAGWIYEIKWDGFRAIVEMAGRKQRLYSRKNQDLAKTFPPVAEALKVLEFDAVLDGEIVVVDESGASHFELIQNYRRTREGTLAYYLFDILYYEGRNLMSVPLLERRELLLRLIPPSPILKISEYVTDGLGLFAVAKEKGLEGIIAKDGASTYQPGVRTESWLKIKTVHQQDAVIGGFTRPRGSRKEFGALVLGVYEGDDLIYIGHTGGGLTGDELRAVRERLDPLITDRSPFRDKPKTNTPATWVKPELVCEVRFQNWTKEGFMRHPVFLGLRDDKRPREVTREIAVPRPARPAAPLKLLPPGAGEKKPRGAAKRSSAPGRLQLLSTPSREPIERQEDEKPRPALKLLGGNEPVAPSPEQEPQSRDGEDKSKLKLLAQKESRLPPVYAELTHLDKIFWPEDGYTKKDLIDYYRAMAPLILPYLRDRPQSLHRFPNGIAGKDFFQKDVETHPPWVKTTPIEEADGNIIHYVVCQNESTLLYLANLGCIELNPWNSRVSALDDPDWFVIDLDPLDVPFEEVVKAANVVYEVMESARIPSYCKTSGATGLHIFVPLAARYNTDQVVQFAKIVAYLVNQRLPQTTSVERSPEKRRNKIYLDFLQNRRGQTLAAPYSVRPRPHAPVSTPLKWSEVKPGLDPKAFTIKTIFQRLDRLGDLWSPVLGAGIDLAAALDRLGAPH